MKEFGSLYRTLNRMSDNRLFEVRKVTLSRAQEYYPLTDTPFERKRAKGNMKMARFTERCDGYYEVDLSADDLLELASELEYLAYNLSLEQEGKNHE